ncbi:MAG: hypothetical protein JSW73_03805 [Candidatus Woesearchaeota archaeon]|nr:MAG: hypothetical protein JSW73_03805 [Candidatus Woesearchaeota archaeon]
MMSKALIALPSLLGILAESNVSAFCIKEVIENKDNEAFKSAVSADWPSLKNFEKIVQKHRTHEVIHEALKLGDYDAWIEAVSALPHAPENLRETVTEADFEILVEIHALNEEGEYKATKALKQELDMPFKHKGRMKPPMYAVKNF